MAATAEEIQEISADFGPGVVLVDWVYLLLLDAWDLFLVTYRNGEMDRIGDLPLKLDHVRKWTDDQLGFNDPLNQRNADYFLHKLDPLVAPLAQITAPGETLIFCPTKALHRVPPRPPNRKSDSHRTKSNRVLSKSFCLTTMPHVH
jgi:hypothetical protein